MTSLGDMFYQNYLVTEQDDARDLTLGAGPGRKDNPLSTSARKQCLEWYQALLQQIDESRKNCLVEFGEKYNANELMKSKFYFLHR